MIDSSKFKLNFIKKEVQSGSYLGMRFSFQKENDALRVHYYPEPFCLEKTPEEKRHSKIFEFSNEGLIEAIDWLNECYSADPAYWEEMYENRMKPQK